MEDRREHRETRNADRKQLLFFSYFLFFANTLDVNSQNRLGETPLTAAVLSKFGSIADYLLECGADPNVQCVQGGYSPLHVAAALGDDRMVEILVRRGAYVNLQDDEGKRKQKILCALPCLFLFVLCSLPSLTSFNLSYLFLSLLPLFPPPGETPLFYAVREGHVTTAMLLLQAGTQVDVEVRIIQLYFVLFSFLFLLFY